MRIGLFTTDFPFREPFALESDAVSGYRWGGVAEVVYYLALSLNARGHTVKVFTTSPTREDIVQKHERMTVYRYGKTMQVGSTILSSGLLWKPLNHDLDVVHGHMGTPPGVFAASAYSKAKRKPLVVTIHTTYNEGSLKGGSYARKLSISLFMNHICAPLLRNADAITTVSLPAMEDSPSYREFVTKAQVIPNGVDLALLHLDISKEECRRRLGIGPEKDVILYVGSLSAYKNPEVLLNAFGRLDMKEEEPLLIMIGDGPLRKGLEERAEDLGLGPRVRLPGFVSDEEKRLYYGAADVFVLPSLGDTFGIVLLEASACGLPVIASDLDVFKTLVKDGHNGLIFSRSDEVDLSLKLGELLKNEERRNEMAVNARANAEQYDWPLILGRYDELYQRLAPHARPTAR